MAKPKRDIPEPSRQILPGYVVAPIFLVWAWFVFSTLTGHTHIPSYYEAFLKILRFPYPQNAEALARHAARIASLLLVILGAWGAGRAASWKWAPAWDNPFEEAGIKLALGFSVLSLGILLLGLAGGLYRPVIVSLVAGFALVSIPDIAASAQHWQRLAMKGAKPRRSLAFTLIFTALLAAGLLAIAPFLLAPETFWDAMVYHLNLPHLYLLNHRIQPTPENIYSGIPSNAQMAYIAAMSIGGPVTAKLVNCFWGCAVALFYGGLAARWKRPGAGLLAAAFFLLTPLALYECYRTSVGLCWSFYQMASVYAFLAAVQEAADSPARRSWWILCGLFTGMAMGVKYPAWGLPAALAAAFAYARTKFSLRWRELALALGTALLTLGPWPAKNLVFYKNPVFPYLQSSAETLWLQQRFKYTSQREADWTALNTDARARDVKAALTTREGFQRYILHPWTFSTTVHGYEMDFMGPLFLSLLPLLLLFKRSDKKPAILGILCLGLWLPLSLVSEMPRFFLPALAPFSFLLADLVVAIPTPGLRFCACAASAVILCGDVLAMAVSPPADHLRAVVSGQQSEADFLRHTTVGYPVPPYAGIEFLNAQAPPDAKVIFIGDSRGLYLQRRYLASSQFAAQTLENLFNSQESPEALRRWLCANGISYFLVNVAEAIRVNPSMFLSAQGKKNYDGFWLRYTQKVFEAQDRGANGYGVIVYSILDDAQAGRPHETDDLFSKIFQISPISAG